MPRDVMWCRCGWDSGDEIYHPMGDEDWPRCPNCSQRLMVDMSKRGKLNMLPPFKEWFSFSGDRWISSRTDMKAWEQELEAKGEYIRGGPARSHLPSEKETRKNIERYGEAYFNAVEQEAAEKTR